MILSSIAPPRSATLAALTAFILARGAAGAPVTDYRTYRSGATTLAGQGTNDPVVGNLSGATASASFLIGYLPAPAVLGANVGDQLQLTFGVSFNDADGMNDNGDNFRFGLFDLNGEAQDSATGGVAGSANYGTAGTSNTDNFRGYWFGTKGGGGNGANGSMRERIAALVSGDNAFAATGANSGTVASLGSVGGANVTLTSDVDGNGAGANYEGVMTLTRTATGIHVSGSFIGDNSPSGNVFSGLDDSLPTSSTFGAVGFLLGSGLSADQAIFSNIDVSVIPASETLTLEVLAAGPHAGAMRLVNKSDAAIDFSYYEINSEAGSLDPAGWLSLADRDPLAPPQGWGEAPGANAQKLSEALILGQEPLAPGQALPLGNAYKGPLNDLELLIGDGANPLRAGSVELVMPGDFNGDGAVDGADLAQWQDGVSAAGDLADADFDGDSDGADFLAWQRNLGQSASFVAAAANVPEPGGFVLALFAVGAISHWLCAIGVSPVRHENGRCVM